MIRKSLILSTGLLAGLAISACQQTANKSTTNAGMQKSANEELSSLERPGFYTQVVDGRLWVLREGSEELLDFKKNGEPAKSVTRPREAPNGMSIRAVDVETIDAYLFAKPGFVTKVHDGKLWVFKEGSKDLADFIANGEPAKSVTRLGVARMPIRAVDAEIIDAYLAKN